MTAFVCIALAFAAAEQAVVNVAVELEPPIIPFHQQARYSVIVEAPADLDVKLPDMVDGFGGLNVYGVPEYRIESLRGGRRRITETYTLDPVFIGAYPIAPVEVTWGEGNDERVTVPSPALRVRDLTEDERVAAEQFETIAGPIGVERALLRDWRFWVPVGATVLAAAAGLLYWMRKRRRVDETAPAAPPWEIAYQRLRDLDLRQLPNMGQFEAYYVELSDILRRYIEDRFHLRAPEETTPEFLAEAAGSGALSSEHQRLLAAFLRHCDRVKFAQYEPTIEEMEQGFAQVLSFVDETVPAPEPAEAEAA